MSFITNIQGNAPANTFVFTTTTVSVDNISVENLSATNATISVLKTDLFSPVNVDATNIDCTNLTVLDTGNFSEIYTSYIHTSNMSLDGTLGGHTGNFVTINADHAIVDALYLNEQSVVLTDKSVIKRDANQVLFIGKNSSTDVTGADFLFKTGEETGGVKLRIPRTSDIVEVIALAADTTIQSTTGIFSAVNVSDLNVADTTTLSELEVLTSASIKNLTVIGPNGLTATKGTITNLSSTKSTLTNASIVNLSISGDFNASGTSRFYNLTAEYFQSYITGVFQDMDAVTGNITTFESNNISNDILIKTINLSAVNTSISNNLQVGSNILCDSMNVTNVLTASTLSAATVNAGILLNASTMNALLVNTSNLSAINASIDNNLNVRFGVTCGTVNTSVSVTAPKLNGTNISSTNISAANITASSTISAPTINATTTLTAPGGSIDNFTTKDIIINDLVTAGSSEFQRGNDKLFIYGDSTSGADITIEPSISRVTMTNISATKITGEISQMLNAGTGIALSTNTNGITTIINTGGSVTDPLNVSTLNASTINVSTLNADEIEGFTKSTEYAFQVTTATPGNQEVTSQPSPTAFPFDLVQVETPDPVYVSGFVSEGYDTTLKQYIIPVDGYYQFGFKLYQDEPTGTNFRCGIFKNGSSVIARGAKVGLGEVLTIIDTFEKGDYIDVRCYVNSGTIYFGEQYTWFWGHKLTPANNQIVSTTNLSIQNLSVSNDITALDVKSTTGTITTLGSTTGTITTLGSTTGTITTINSTTINASKLNASNISVSGEIDFGIVLTGPLVEVNQIIASQVSLNGLRVNSSASIDTLNTSNINTSNISAINISATAMTFDTASGSKSITTIGEIDAVKFNASSVYISNDLTLEPGGSMRVQSLVPGNDFYIYTNTGNTFLGNLGTGNLNIGNGFITDDISISPSGVITVDNLTSTNAITAPSATITNISATDLTIATSLTGAGSINITGDVSAGIINGTTLTGNIAGNLSAGTGIVLSTVAGVTNISNLAPYQLPASRVYARINQINEAPLATSLFYYTTFDTLTLDCPYVSFTPPNINTGGANSGFIINTQGTYKITYTQCVHSISYTNRVNWWTRLLKNGTPQFCATFIYTRSDNSQFAQYGSGSTSQILVLEVGDYLQLQTRVAKNSPAFNDDFSGLEGFSGSSFILELLS